MRMNYDSVEVFLFKHNDDKSLLLNLILLLLKPILIKYWFHNMSVNQPLKANWT